jgi:hypothetical protein
MRKVIGKATIIISGNKLAKNDEIPVPVPSDRHEPVLSLVAFVP